MSDIENMDIILGNSNLGENHSGSDLASERSYGQHEKKREKHTLRIMKSETVPKGVMLRTSQSER